MVLDGYSIQEELLCWEGSMLSPWCCDIMEIDFVVLGYKGGVALQYQSGKLYGRMVS